MQTATQELIQQIWVKHANTNAWFAVEKGMRRGLFFKRYILLYNPKQNKIVYYKAWQDEYMDVQIGTAYTHTSFRD